MNKVTREQYICARDLLREYRNNPDFKSCGIEYMDDAERNSYELAKEILHKYSEQIADIRRQIKKQKVK